MLEVEQAGAEECSNGEKYRGRKIQRSGRAGFEVAGDSKICCPCHSHSQRRRAV